MKNPLKKSTDIRCKKCNKLVAKISSKNIYEIKCTRCGTINLVFDEMQEQVIITDSEGKIVYVNRAVEITTGYSILESMGKKPSELWGGNMDQEFYENMWNKMLDERRSVNFVMKNRRKDGSLYDVELTVSPIIDNQDNIIYFVGIEINSKIASGINR